MLLERVRTGKESENRTAVKSGGRDGVLVECCAEKCTRRCSRRKCSEGDYKFLCGANGKTDFAIYAKIKKLSLTLQCWAQLNNRNMENGTLKDSC